METGSDRSPQRQPRGGLPQRIGLVDEAPAERVVMLVTAGKADAQLARDVRFGVAVDTPAPLAPAPGIGRAGAAVAARARRTAGNDALSRGRGPSGTEAAGSIGSRRVDAR